MKSRSLLLFAFLLLIAGAFPSCKSPTATTQSSAFTLILPDSTVAWGDSAMMRVVPAKPLSSSSVFTWSFGDSSSLVSRSDTIIHYYPDTGVFTVKVALNDTSNKSQLGSESGTVHVAARHFNLALLQTMTMVDVIWNAKIASDTFPSQFYPLCYSCSKINFYGIDKNLSWEGTSFSIQASTGYDDTTPHGLYYWVDSDSTEIFSSGSIDPGLTQVASFSADTNAERYEASPYSGNEGLGGTYQSTFTIHSVPFKSESDTDVVFEAVANTVENAKYNSTIFSWDVLEGQLNVQSKFNQVYSVIIRFHR